jgi:tRNA (guanine-N(7)-)-methyltransferase subunit TRM82
MMTAYHPNSRRQAQALSTLDDHWSYILLVKMKQFLHTSGPTITVALNQHAYGIVSSSLDPNDGAATEALGKKVNVFELLPPQLINSPNPAQAPHNIHLKNEGYNNSLEVQQRDNAVQAVASKWEKDSKNLICAVSRYDKSICVYIISTSDSSFSDEANASTSVKPIASYKTNKRCCSLQFAVIPGSSKESSGMMILISGDLAGDATAFPVEKSAVEEGLQKDKFRLLLGHTASMLTQIKIVEGREGKILTSDRDEKIRVSSFPQTFHVEGYLLGHKAYVTDMDILDHKHCVSTSGDGTIRLWDYTTCREVAKISVRAINDNEKANESTTDEQLEMPVQDEKSCDEKPKQVGSTGLKGIYNPPVRVASNKSGTVVAVIRDLVNDVDFFSINLKEGITAPYMQKMESVKCPSQPLALTFCEDDTLCILTRDPTFLMRLHKDKNSDTYSSVVCELSATLKKIGSSIVMPSSLLEVDESGKLKVMKNVNAEREGFVKHEPWLSVERVEKAKQATLRRKKRLRERDKNAKI